MKKCVFFIIKMVYIKKNIITYYRAGKWGNFNEILVQEDDLHCLLKDIFMKV